MARAMTFSARAGLGFHFGVNIYPFEISKLYISELVRTRAKKTNIPNRPHTSGYHYTRRRDSSYKIW